MCKLPHCLLIYMFCCLGTRWLSEFAHEMYNADLKSNETDTWNSHRNIVTVFWVLRNRWEPAFGPLFNLSFCPKRKKKRKDCDKDAVFFPLPSPLILFYHSTNFHQTWYEYYATGTYPNVVIFWSLRSLTKIEVPGIRMEYLIVFLSIESGSHLRLSTGRDSN